MLLAAAFVIVTANPYLDDGRARFAALEFEAAARALAVAMDEPRLSTEDRRQGFDLWAQSLLALGRGEEAVTVYSRLLKDDPHAPTPVAAPKVVEAFTRARQATWPPPSVSLAPDGDAGPGGEVQVRVTDPWSLVKRVRRLEDGPGGIAERPSPPVIDHRVTVTPSPQAQRLLLDALDAGGVLLAHLELAVTPAALPALPPPAETVVARGVPSAPWLPVLLGAAGLVSSGLGGVFLFFGFRDAPRLEPASEINAWNSAATRNAAVGWTLVGAAALLVVVAAVVAAR